MKPAPRGKVAAVALEVGADVADLVVEGAEGVAEAVEVVEAVGEAGTATVAIAAAGEEATAAGRRVSTNYSELNLFIGGELVGLPAFLRCEIQVRVSIWSSDLSCNLFKCKLLSC